MKKQKTKICKQCGAENPAKSKYCQSCGSKISPSVARKIFKWIFIVIAALFILFVCVVIWAFLEVKKEDEQQTKTAYNRAVENEIAKIQDDYKQSEEYKQIYEEDSSKPQLSETERAEKEQLLKEKLSKLKHTYDEFNEVHRYYSVNTPVDNEGWSCDQKTFISPIIANYGDSYMLSILSNYYGYGWLFINDVTVKIDGEFYEPYPKPMKPDFERESCYGGYVSEYCVNSVKTLDNTLTNSQYYEILKLMANGNDVVVRFSGSKGTEDLIIDKDRQAIKEVLEAWDIIEELYGK